MKRLLFIILIIGLCFSLYFRFEGNNLLSDYIIEVLIAIGTVGAVMVALWEKPKVLCKKINTRIYKEQGVKYKEITLYIKNNTEAKMLIFNGYFLGFGKRNVVMRIDPTEMTTEIYPFQANEIKVSFYYCDNKPTINDIINAQSELNWFKKTYYRIFKIQKIIFTSTVAEIKIKVDLRNL